MRLYFSVTVARADHISSLRPVMFRRPDQDFTTVDLANLEISGYDWKTVETCASR